MNDFQGVLHTITTNLTADQEVDFAGVRAHVAFQIEGVSMALSCAARLARSRAS